MGSYVIHLYRQYLENNKILHEEKSISGNVSSQVTVLGFKAAYMSA